ncbi:5'-3' exonuclease family protein [Artemisia annua]|uniref:5'-3' exonuclease family protein n=1 Tax=Artemisia annua TaxID=35608 RepID=A0A2U1NG90_ARTAN|nr:5'-3' exonuclease family protein [Artemisia annua]
MLVDNIFGFKLTTGCTNGSHLQGMFNRTIRLLESGLKPVYVFDGAPPDLKKQELAKRYSRREDATAGLNEAIQSGNKDDIEKFSKRIVQGNYAVSRGVKGIEAVKANAKLFKARIAV